MAQDIYDVVIIGGGASGTALLYTLAKYSNLSKILLIEKYDALGQVNSSAKNNSQTLHVGDIETNYSIAKVREVKPAALMVKHYIDTLPVERQKSILEKMHKMVLGVGEEEVSFLENRFIELQALFPEIQKLSGAQIAEVEPAVMHGRDIHEKVCALFSTEGYAVDFSLLAQSFVHEAQKNIGVEVILGESVLQIIPTQEGYTLKTNKGFYQAKVVIVNTDAYSLGFAKSLGYGNEFSLIPVAGSFYFSEKKLNGKVYTVQEPRLPFAAVHGDPDLTEPSKTRFGPTARFFPVLESRNLQTMGSYFASAGLGKINTWKSFFQVLLEPIRFFYLFKNLCYEIPFLGTYLFARDIKKIIPTITMSELTKAYGYGGMRLQRVNIHTGELLLGEGKIVGKNIIFNMTPSPGASVCLYNACRDAEQVVTFLPQFSFKKEQMQKELM